ncbi:hypothetical protein GN244_ATG10962 [Phytophthora infestans]|uniref:Secreted RxLR effector peptide protein n=1 Tax=Phytophthora infestans TaxID=4787 RepID=A0A833WIT1_PHYIN|nr:hypothetical protein GN244_ATG10962 [Phytophthora infestans]KAF4149081.1 hypothetical protein GN958_ATG01734 [Phytophthora infestans]
MRGLIALLAIQATVTILVNDPAVAGHVANNVQRLLRKHEPDHDDTEHDTESTNEERVLSAAVKAFAEKLKGIWTVGKVDDVMNDIPELQRLGQADHIDESIKAMLVGKNI